MKGTVVTVVYNGEATIGKTIESVLSQTCPPFQYVIVDGLSSDGTMNIVRSYEQAMQEKGILCTIISEKDTGIYNAMNKGIRAAKGDFISFLNAGDRYEPDALQQVSALYEKTAFDLTYGALHYIRPDGTVTVKRSKPDRRFVTSRHWNHPSMFLRASLYREFGFDESFPAYADFQLYLRLRRAGVKIAVCDAVITNFSADGVSTNVQLSKVLARAKEKYRAYRSTGYSRLYWLESYGWELFKSFYFRLHS